MTDRPPPTTRRREGRENKKHPPTEKELAFRAALGKRIREWRYPKYNQDELASAVDVYRTHISTIEQGRTDIRLSTLLRISDALGVSVDELLRGLQPDANLEKGQ